MYFSKFETYSDGAGWSLDWDKVDISDTLRSMSLKPSTRGVLSLFSPRTLNYFVSRDRLLQMRSFLRLTPSNSIAVDHFHGTPLDANKYERYFNFYRENLRALMAIRVTNSSLALFFENYGLREKVIQVPLGVDLNIFSPIEDLTLISELKRRFRVPEGSFVVGSFQKDGLGWGDGNEPKLEKGPDVFLEVMRGLKAHEPTLHVLLTGPARGYVMRGLTRLGISWSHTGYLKFEELREAYACIDIYLISSRTEGGPKAALETLACAKPLVSSAVGQVPDLRIDYRHGAMIGSLNPEEAVDAILRSKGRVFSSAELVQKAKDFSKVEIQKLMADSLQRVSSN